MSAPAKNAPLLHFPNIHVLRGLAAISVVLYHIIELLPWPHFPHSLPLGWFRIGWMGVDLFFVISGCLIALSALKLADNYPNTAHARHVFLRHRLARIVPLYALTCMVFVLFVQPDMLEKSRFWLHALTHLTFTHNLFPATHGSINGPTWSVAAEMQFYLIMALALPWVGRWRAGWVIAIGLALAWGLRSAVFAVAEAQELDHTTRFIYATQAPMMADAFAFGIALALLAYRGVWQGWWATTRARWALALAAVGTSALALTLFFPHAGDYWSTPAMLIFWRSLLCLSFALWLGLAMVAQSAALERSWPHRALVYLGDISYGVYLWHMPVILMLKRSMLATPAIAEPLTFTALTFALTLGLSALTWHMLEKPCIRHFR